MTQGTQGLLGERGEQLGSSDRGVIKFRKIVLDAIETASNGGRPKGVVGQQRCERNLSIGNPGGCAGKELKIIVEGWRKIRSEGRFLSHALG